MAAAGSQLSCAVQMLLEAESCIDERATLGFGDDVGAFLDAREEEMKHTQVRKLALLAIEVLRYLPIAPGDPFPRGLWSPAQGLEALPPAPLSNWALPLCSEVDEVLEGKKRGLLEACFRAVLFLPHHWVYVTGGHELRKKVSAG